MAKVALVYNMIQPSMLRNGPLDLMAEYDSEETISATQVTGFLKQPRRLD